MKKVLITSILMLYGSVTFSMQTQERTYNKNKTNELQKLLSRCELNYMVTCLPGQIAQIEKLVREGADPNIKMQNARGQTVLQLAIEYVTENKLTPRFVELLLQYGARPNFRNNYGESALDWAIFRDPRLLRVLIPYKANIHEKDRFNRTPLRMAIESGKIDAVQILLENGAASDITPDDIKIAKLSTKNKEIIDLLETYRGAIQEPTNKIK